MAYKYDNNDDGYGTPAELNEAVEKEKAFAKRKRPKGEVEPDVRANAAMAKASKEKAGRDIWRRKKAMEAAAKEGAMKSKKARPKNKKAFETEMKKFRAMQTKKD